MVGVRLRGQLVSDLVFLVLILSFFLASMGLAWLAERLMR